MQRASNLFLTLLLIFTAMGCKKQDTSPGAQEADAIEPTSGEPSTESAEEEEQASEQSAESAPEVSAPVQEEAAAEKSEDVFTVKLETTKGDIIIDVHRDWAPLGAERFHELVASGFYNDVAFFRVMQGFMAQTGISGKPKLNKKWGNKTILDEPPKQSNTRGMVTFAKAGINSRTTQFFINLVDNTQLDSMLFSPFGKVRDMAAADALYSGYGDGPPAGKGPNQQRIKQQGNKYLKKKFPELDYIRSAIIIEE